MYVSDSKGKLADIVPPVNKGIEHTGIRQSELRTILRMYEIGIFGHLSETERAILADTIEGMVAEFGLVVGRHVILHDAASVANRDVHAALAAIYFGAPHHPQQDVVREIWRDNAPIIPAIGPAADMTDIPPFLQSLNTLRRQNDEAAWSLAAWED